MSTPTSAHGLNLAQQEAVNYLHGPCLVLAGAGLASYLILCWLLDISDSRRRMKIGLAFFRTKLANINIG